LPQKRGLPGYARQKGIFTNQRVLGNGKGGGSGDEEQKNEKGIIPKQNGKPNLL
jgi:hypothetical protein